MGKRVLTVFIIALLVGVTGLVAAAPKDGKEAKVELERLQGVHKYAKETVVPLINCYVQHQPYLQRMYGDYPEKGREHVRAMDYCTTRYTADAQGADKLNDIKTRALAIMKRDVELGYRYCDAWVDFNRLKDEKASQGTLDEKKAAIEAMKQELFKNASEFAKVQQDFQTWMKDFNKYYAEVQRMAQKG